MWTDSLTPHVHVSGPALPSPLLLHSKAFLEDPAVPPAPPASEVSTRGFCLIRRIFESNGNACEAGGALAAGGGRKVGQAGGLSPGARVPFCWAKRSFLPQWTLEFLGRWQPRRSGCCLDSPTKPHSQRRAVLVRFVGALDQMSRVRRKSLCRLKSTQKGSIKYGLPVRAESRLAEMIRSYPVIKQLPLGLGPKDWM